MKAGMLELDEREFNLNDLVRDVAEMIHLSVENRRQNFFLIIDDSLHAQVLGISSGWSRYWSTFWTTLPSIPAKKETFPFPWKS